MALQVSQLTIIGTGLLGGSIGLGLRAAGFKGKILGVGRRPQTLARALQLGCIDSAAPDLSSAAADSDLVILATPIGQFDQLLHDLSRAGRPSLVTTDVGSTKSWVLALARQTLPLPRAKRFIGSHPMAGSELHGPDSASPDLFQGRPCFLTPDPDSDPAALALVESLWTTLGMRLLRATPADHDRLVASISHLPHALAVLLVQLAVRRRALDAASTGFRDLTRIASSDPAVWRDIFATNRQAVIDSIAELQKDLTHFQSLLATGSESQLLQLLESAKSARDQWTRNLSAPPPD